MMSEQERKYRFVSLGEALLRLSPPRFTQLRKASSLDVVVVGSQPNVASNLARLGWRTAFLSKLPNNSLGRMVIDALLGYGVDTSHIKMVDGGKMGVTYVEFSAAPRTPLALYDRSGSTASSIAPEDFPWESLLCQTQFAFTDGIFPGLSASCRAASKAFLQAAKKAGCMVYFDVNYREHLWDPKSAREAWSQLLPNVDILITNRNVSENVFNFEGPDKKIMKSYADEFGCSVVCFTKRKSHSMFRGSFKSYAFSEGAVVEGLAQEFDIIDRYGTGDAWAAGFLYGYEQKGVKYGLDFANALLALSHTTFGDIAHFTPEQVLAVMNGTDGLSVRR